jgi:hypothetical protein
MIRFMFKNFYATCIETNAKRVRFSRRNSGPICHYETYQRFTLKFYSFTVFWFTFHT